MGGRGSNSFVINNRNWIHIGPLPARRPGGCVREKDPEASVLDLLAMNKGGLGQIESPDARTDRLVALLQRRRLRLCSGVEGMALWMAPRKIFERDGGKLQPPTTR